MNTKIAEVNLEFLTKDGLIEDFYESDNFARHKLPNIYFL